MRLSHSVYQNCTSFRAKQYLTACARHIFFIDTWITPVLCLLWIMLLGTWVYKPLFRILFLILSKFHSEVQFLGYQVIWLSIFFFNCNAVSMAAAHFAFVSMMLKLPVSPCPPQWLLLFVFRALPNKMSVRFLNLVLGQAITSFTKRWTHSEDAHLPVLTTWRKGDAVLLRGVDFKDDTGSSRCWLLCDHKGNSNSCAYIWRKMVEISVKGKDREAGQERREGAWDGRRERGREWKGN